MRKVIFIIVDNSFENVDMKFRQLLNTGLTK